MQDGSERVFLFLQGPHGPFFRRLAGSLAARGARVARVAFNAADVAEWGDAGPVYAYAATPDGFAPWLDRLIGCTGATDLVLYGDTRPLHATALARARALGLRAHCLEEGYLRPHWITYERSGTNGHSPLCEVPLEAMAAALGEAPPPAALPAHWGDARQHLWWSARYHGRLLLPSARFRAYRGHRDLPLWREAALYWKRALSLPQKRVQRALQTRRLARAGRPFHLALLQLSFDCSMQAHSPYRANAEFVAELMDGFAAGAPPSHDLVFKAHPFEDGRERLGRVIADGAAARGLAGRVHFIDGGCGLGPLLDRAETVSLINSTAGHQALARGLPVFAAGRAVYTRPELVASGAPAAFFARPSPPDAHAYRLFRSFMLRATQLEGSFYSARGIGRALEALPTAMLADADPYQRLLGPARTSELAEWRPNAADRIVA